MPPTLLTAQRQKVKRFVPRVRRAAERRRHLLGALLNRFVTRLPVQEVVQRAGAFRTPNVAQAISRVVFVRAAAEKRNDEQTGIPIGVAGICHMGWEDSMRRRRPLIARWSGRLGDAAY